MRNALLLECGGLSGLTATDTWGDADESWGQIKGSPECLAKKAGLYDVGIEESLKMSEESKNVFNYIKHCKLGDKIKGFTGSQNPHIGV